MEKNVVFVEGKGRVKNPEVREAFYYQIFDIPAKIWWVLFSGFAGVFFLYILHPASS